MPSLDSILNRLDDYAGKPDLDGLNLNPGDRHTIRLQMLTPMDPGEYDPTHWGFRVMAVNRVVQRHAVDGTIAPDTDTR